MYRGQEKERVVVFDFDGTLTRKDTLFEFIRFAKGKYALLCGIIRNSPFIIAYLLKFYPNYKAKQRLFSYFFKGMSYDEFRLIGRNFSKEIDLFVNHPQLLLLKKHLQDGDKVYVISASITEWVSPWCFAQGITHVLCTDVEVTDSLKLTGRFRTKNCYGQEKVNRLLEIESDRHSYWLIAYGESKGDREMLSFADEGHLIT